MDMKKIATCILSMLAILAIALPAAASSVPGDPSLNVDSSIIESVTPFDGSVVRAQLVRETTGAAGISRQEVTGVETPVPMNYNPYFPFIANPARISNWGWGWGGLGWGGWGWPLWNNWGWGGWW